MRSRDIDFRRFSGYGKGMKHIVFIGAGLVILAFAIVFGNWDLSEGIFLYAPILILFAAALIGFGVLFFHLGQRTADPLMAKEFMLVLYDAADAGAIGCAIFHDDDGWWKMISDASPEDGSEYLAIYDKVEYLQLRASIDEFLTDKENPGQILEKYLPDNVAAVHVYEEDGRFVVIFERGGNVPMLIDTGVEELVIQDAIDL